MKKPSLFGAVCAVLITAAPLSVNATTVWSANLVDNNEELWTLHVITNEDTREQVHDGASVFLDSAKDNGTVAPADLLTCHLNSNCYTLAQGDFDAVSLLSDPQPSVSFDGTSGTLNALLHQRSEYPNLKSGRLTCDPSMNPYNCDLTISNLTGPSGDPTPFHAPDHGKIIFSITTSTTLETITELVNIVIDLNLQNGISNALDSKLDSAIQALEDANSNNDISAINSLNAFINSVEAQRGNKITDAEADTLIADAQAVIDSLTQ